MKTLLILVLDGVMDSSLAITLDTLKTAQWFATRATSPANIRVITTGHRSRISTGAGLKLRVDYTFHQLLASDAKPDWVIIPGMGLSSLQEIRSRFSKRDVISAIQTIKALRDDGAEISASCSSVFLLAHAGLLEGRRVTMTWWLADSFRSSFPNVTLEETKMVVRDGPYMTAGAAFSQLDLVLALVADAIGIEIAHLCSRYMLIDQRSSQARYMMPTHSRVADAIIVTAEAWIDENLAAPISVVALAAKFSLSPRTFARRILVTTGMSPIKFIQRRRLLRASYLIETTHMSIDAIAANVGYQNGIALRKLIKREFGVTPRALR